MKKLSFLALVFFVFNSTAQICWHKLGCSVNYVAAIDSNSKLYHWGSDPNSSYSPIQFGTDSDWNSICGGAQFTLAIKNNGTLWGWGANNAGQIGLGYNGTTIINPTQIGINTDWIYSSAGYIHSICLKSNGTLWSWGGNQYGELGDGSSGNFKTSPIQVGIENNWSVISAGGHHCLAIKNDGTLWAWGYNNYGQLGDGTLVNKSVPTQIGSDTNWQNISASYTNSLALKSDGTLWAWGYNNAGQVGNGTNNFTPVISPSQVGIDNDWQKISSGYYSSYALKQNGKLYHFGANGEGQNGNGSTTPSSMNLPTQVGNDVNWTSIYSNLEYVMAIKSNGNLYSWGYNAASGVLGIGNTIDQYSPVLVTSCNLATTQFANTTVTVYPNPTSTILNISNDNVTITKIIVVDMLGKKILEQNGNATQINVSALQKGLYVLQVYSDGEVSNYKFVRE